MTERENVLQVIHHTGQAEWIPNIDDAFDRIFPTKVVRERPPFGQSGYDWFGCYWLYDPATIGFMQSNSHPLPMDDVTKWQEQVRFPDLNAIDWENAVKPTLESLDRDNHLMKMSIESGIFERFHALIGFEDALIAFYEEPEASKDLLAALTDFRIAEFERIIQYYQPDIICNFDDLGSKQNSFMSMDMFREFLAPHYKRIVSTVTSRGVIYEHHSCGKMDAFVPDLVDMGVTMFNAVQPCNDVDFIQDNFSDRIVIDGGIDTQMVIDYPGSTEEDMRREVRRTIDKLAPYGNLICGTYSCFPEHNAICSDEIRKYGREFIKRNSLIK